MTRNGQNSRPAETDPYVGFVELDTEGKESLDWQKLSFKVKANQWYASLVAMGLSYSSSNVGLIV